MQCQLANKNQAPLKHMSVFLQYSFYVADLTMLLIAVLNNSPIMGPNPTVITACMTPKQTVDTVAGTVA